MQLENPELSRRMSDLVADHNRADIAGRLARLNRALASQNKADTDLIDTLRRILQSPNPQAERLRELLKGIVNG
jgi:hypothetical protein